MFNNKKTLWENRINNFLGLYKKMNFNLNKFKLNLNFFYNLIRKSYFTLW